LTVSNPAPTTSAADVRTAIAELRRSGHRISASRRQVLDALYAAHAPVTAEEIAGGLDGRLPSSDAASVYRTLELLERVGLARHVHLGHGPGRYAPASAGERDYFVCERCSEVRAADPRALEPVREAIAKAFGWRVRFSHFPIAGLCPRCAAKEYRR
jgi:Fur family ferric uptake transcriptional regulator